MLKWQHLNFKHHPGGRRQHPLSFLTLSFSEVPGYRGTADIDRDFQSPPSVSSYCSGIAEISKDALLHNLLPFLRVLKGRELRTLWKARAHSRGDDLSARTSFPNKPALEHAYWPEGTCARVLKRALGMSPAVNSMLEKETNRQEIRRKPFTSGNLY